MLKRSDWTALGHISVLRQRAMVVTVVALVHVAAIMAWLKLPPVSPIVTPDRDIEVAMLVPPEVIHAGKPRVQLPAREARLPVPRVDLPEPQTPHPELAVREDPVPAVATGGTGLSAKPSPLDQTVGQGADPESNAVPESNAAYLNNQLIYPPIARRMGIQGRVVLDVEVLADGLCGQAAIAQSSGHELLDRAALESVRSWHFLPARRGAQAVTRWVRVPIKYSLKDDEA